MNEYLEVSKIKEVSDIEKYLEKNKTFGNDGHTYYRLEDEYTKNSEFMVLTDENAKLIGYTCEFNVVAQGYIFNGKPETIYTASQCAKIIYDIICKDY